MNMSAFGFRGYNLSSLVKGSSTNSHLITLLDYQDLFRGLHVCRVHPSFLAVMEGETSASKVANSLSPSTTHDLGLWELVTVKFPFANGNNIGSSSRRVKKKRNSREERKLDNEYDIFWCHMMVSGTESDDSDWSIGWSEPHKPEFHDEFNEINNSFAVLVPCYGHGVHTIADRPQIKILGPTGNFSDGLPAESMKCMEQWLSSLQNN